MLKIGQKWGKIENYPPQCSTKIGTPGGRQVEAWLEYQNISLLSPDQSNLVNKM